MRFRYFTLLIFLLMLSSCARRGRPEGGPKDFDKPIMVKADPDFKSLQFKEDQIRIYFDEFVKLKEVSTQLIVSPPLKYNPVISPLGSPSKRITIKLSDTLQENTTYTFNFAQSIIDNTEGNILDNFKYIFSTGDYIDSLKVVGRIKDSYDLEMKENPTIMLYPVDTVYKDSIIYNEKPTYVGSTTDSLNNWEITNIKAGTYRLIALNDASKNYKYNPKEDKIGFYPDFITLPGDTVFNLSLFKEKFPFKLVSRPKDVSKGHLIIGFEGDSDDVQIRILSDTPNDFKAFYAKDRRSDTLNYWFNHFELDSMVLELSKDKFLDTVKIRIDEEEIDSLRLELSSYGMLNPRDTLQIASSVPMMKIDSSKFHFLDKDSLVVPLKLKMSERRDRIDFEFDQELNQNYKLFIEPGAIEDILGVQNDTIQSSLKTGKVSDYCSIFLTIRGIERFPTIVHLINQNGDLIDETYATGPQEFQYRNLKPSRFKIRIIYDDNENGKWDTGDFLNNVQPEQVYYINSIIEAKANWEVEESIQLVP